MCAEVSSRNVLSLTRPQLHRMRWLLPVGRGRPGVDVECLLGIDGAILRLGLKAVVQE